MGEDYCTHIRELIQTLGNILRHYPRQQAEEEIRRLPVTEVIFKRSKTNVRGRWQFSEQLGD